MKGIILAGGSGTRLSPLTIAVSKQLMPVYDKPMIYYPISTLMLSGIKDILIIVKPNDLIVFEKLLGNGSQYGCKFSYEIQKEPRGIADAFILGEKFIGNDNVALILGDNIFHSSSLTQTLRKIKEPKGGVIFAYPVKNPTEYGIVEFDEKFRVISLEEKPKKPKSNYAIPGLYFYNNSVIDIAKSISPSERNELEITDINNEYFQRNMIDVIVLSRGTAWLDTGTFSSLQEAGQFIEVIQNRQGLKVGCIEEIAFNQGYIDSKQLQKLSKQYMKNEYGKYLTSLIK